MNPRSEIVDLVSEGYFYPSGSVLSCGKVFLLPVTAQHEELLASTNLLRRGLAEKELLNNIVEGGVDYDELLDCDRKSILLNLRIANYGAYTRLKIKCEECDKDYEDDISFAFRSRPFDFRQYERGVNKLSYTFSRCKKNVYFRLATCNEFDIYNKQGWLAFAKAITISIDDTHNINNFYEYELSAIESSQFRKYYETRTLGFVNDVALTCSHCNAVKKTKMDVNHEILGIQPESRLNIHGEIFDLCYYSNGAFTQEGVYKMPVSLRTFYIKKLIDAKKAENDANKSASEGKGQSTALARPPTVKK